MRVLWDVVQVDAAAAAQNAYEQIGGFIQSGGGDQKIAEQIMRPPYHEELNLTARLHN